MHAGARAVKLEGGRHRRRQIETLIEARIPVLGHLGMLPQAVREEGGYKIKGRTAQEREILLEDAEALAKAGVFAIVLELVAPEAAAAITRRVSVPTIGIGSGAGTCDGEILVVHDLLGLFPWFRPKFVHEPCQLADDVRAAARAYRQRVEKSAP
jgi:3-methyl-2-oxobutanoate hydroxymethyltransferase